jgi:hypothetical protein
MLFRRCFWIGICICRGAPAQNRGLALPNQEPCALKTSLGMMAAGAAGGAVAIALIEDLSTRAAFPLIFVPFATSIVLIMALAWPERWW